MKYHSLDFTNNNDEIREEDDSVWDDCSFESNREKSENDNEEKVEEEEGFTYELDDPFFKGEDYKHH